MSKKKDKIEKESFKNPEERIASLREGLRKIRFDTSGAKSKNVKAIKNMRREVAVLFTRIKENNNNKPVKAKAVTDK